MNPPDKQVVIREGGMVLVAVAQHLAIPLPPPHLPSKRIDDSSSRVSSQGLPLSFYPALLTKVHFTSPIDCTFVLGNPQMHSPSRLLHTSPTKLHTYGPSTHSPLKGINPCLILDITYYTLLENMIAIHILWPHLHPTNHERHASSTALSHPELSHIHASSVHSDQGNNPMCLLPQKSSQQSPRYVPP